MRVGLPLREQARPAPLSTGPGTARPASATAISSCARSSSKRASSPSTSVTPRCATKASIRSCFRLGIQHDAGARPTERWLWLRLPCGGDVSARARDSNCCIGVIQDDICSTVCAVLAIAFARVDLKRAWISGESIKSPRDGEANELTRWGRVLARSPGLARHRLPQPRPRICVSSVSAAPSNQGCKSSACS